MTTKSISRFTPSLMAQDLLERLFVARTKVLDAVMQRIEAASSSKERNHTLLVGPRGAGKTHLVSLAYHRTQQMRERGARLSVSWLPEDPWTIVSYRHLLTAVVTKLDPPLPGPAPKDVALLENLIVNRAREHGPIAVFLENLDVILDNLGDDGQQKLRHLLQDERPLLLIATTTRLDRDFFDEARPFFDFFTTTRLQPFEVDEAAEMLSRIAHEREDEGLVRYLQTEAGQARLRTIAHLAGGQPRMWAALASALTIERLDDLVDLLLTRFDDLTPYYQEQLARLSPQQRLIVAELAEADRPLNVKDLADRLDLDQRSIGKSLSDLTDRGWVSPTSSVLTERLDKRRTYYDLAEPLARLSFQLKESRGEPLRLIIDFLKLWFDPHELSRAAFDSLASEYVLVARSSQDGDPIFAITRQLRRLPTNRVPALELLGAVDDALASLDNGDPEPLLRLPTPLRRAIEELLVSPDDTFAVRSDIHGLAADEFGFVKHPAMAEWILRAEDLVANQDDAAYAAEARLQLADWLGRSWLFDAAVAVIDLAAEALGPHHTSVMSTKHKLATSLWSAGKTPDAITLERSVLADLELVVGPEAPPTLTARGNLAHSYWSAGRIDEAIILEESVLADRERLAGSDAPDTLTARSNLAASYSSIGRTEDALELHRSVLADRERVLGHDHPSTLTSRSNLASTYRTLGRLDEAISLHESVLADRERILGPDHPSTLVVRGNLAHSYWSADRIEDAIALEESVLEKRRRILGPDHPSTLTVRSNLAHSYRSIGRVVDAIDLQRAALADSERVLGSDHPDTVEIRSALQLWEAEQQDG